MKQLEPLLPGETRSEYLDRLESDEKVAAVKLTDDTMREIYGFAHARRGVHPGDLEAMVRRVLVREAVASSPIADPDDYCEECKGPCLRRPPHGEGWG